MTTICKKCGWQIEKLTFSEETALEIWGLLIQEATLSAINKVKDEFRIDLKNAKGVTLHFNPVHGKCHNCNYSQLDREFMECPKCKAFNYNLQVEPPFNMDFCSALEYRLDFSQFEDENIKSLWCDGISHLPADISSLSVNNLKQQAYIKTKAWIGKDGQGHYDMTIHFGPQALSNYINRKDLQEYIPEAPSGEWIKIDPEQKQIEIILK